MFQNLQLRDENLSVSVQEPFKTMVDYKECPITKFKTNPLTVSKIFAVLIGLKIGIEPNVEIVIEIAVIPFKIVASFPSIFFVIGGQQVKTS